MSEDEKGVKQKPVGDLGRRSFFFTIMGGAIAAIAGWIAGIFPRTGTRETKEATSSPLEDRISALEARAAEQSNMLLRIKGIQPIAELQGDNNDLVVFDKKELPLIKQDSEAVFLNLVNLNGGVGIRFYKDFGFGNEEVKNPWSIWIEGVKGFQSLAIIRDWRFTAALWDEDGKLTLGRLDPYPPGNQPAKARFDVRGTVDEVQAMVEASSTQTTDIFQVISGDGTKRFTIDSKGKVVIGSPEEPKEVILHDSMDGSAYALQVTNGQLAITKIS